MTTEKLVNGHTAPWHAVKALYNAEARASVHATRGDYAKATRCLQRGITTARSWLEGTHKKLS